MGTDNGLNNYRGRKRESARGRQREKEKERKTVIELKR